MKPIHPTLIAALLGAASVALAQAEVSKSEKPQASASSGGNHSSSVKKSVTVTSDGKQTIRKTVTIRDGKEEVITEITDALGKVTKHEGNGKDDTTAESGQSGSATGEDKGPWLGIHVQAAPAVLRDQLGLEEDEGVVVEVLARQSPAAKADIRVNDILLSLDETKLSSPSDLRDELRKHAAGDSVQLKVLRKGQRSDVTVVLEEKQGDDAENHGNPPPTDAKNDSGSGHGDAHVDAQGGEGSIDVKTSSSTSSGFDDVINDPNVPEQFKKTVREMKEKMREFEEKHGIRKEGNVE
jgi:C-terminal processing protease CtpA/Prc